VPRPARVSVGGGAAPGSLHRSPLQE
jgi:hypothetical protein